MENTFDLYRKERKKTTFYADNAFKTESFCNKGLWTMESTIHMKKYDVQVMRLCLSSAKSTQIQLKWLISLE